MARFNQRGRRHAIPAVAVVVILMLAGAGCEQESPIDPSPDCAYALSANLQLFPADGGTAVATVTTTAECAWTATTSAVWIGTQGATSGVGTGNINLVIAANPSNEPRTGSIAVADRTLPIAQEGRTPCAFDVSPSSATYVAQGGSGTLQVSTADGCPWVAETTDAWLTISTGAGGIGSGTVAYTVLRNEATSSRVGTITVAGRAIRIEQGAAEEPEPTPTPLPCQYGVSPVEIVLHWHHTGGEINLTTTAGCTWTVTPGADWLSILTGGAGSGPNVIRFALSIFTEDATRRAPVQVRWPTPTAGQNVWVTQEGCRYGFSESSRDVAATGATVTMTVVTQAISASCSIGCPWIATSLVPWIQIATPMPQAGDGQLVYRVNANTTGQPRVGEIRIQNQTITVRQPAQGGH